VDKEIIVIANESKIDGATAKNLKETFMPIFEKAEQLAKKAKNIVVKDMEDTDAMESARELRLSLKRLRCDTDTTRKELKEESVRKNKAIDGMANIIKYLIIPIEERLQKQEDYIQDKIKEARNNKINERANKVIELEGDPCIYNLGDMSEDSFTDLLDSLKYQQDKKKEAEVKEEADRIETEKVERERQEGIRLENEKLKKERDKKEKADAKQKVKHDAELQKEKDKAETERLKRVKGEREIEAAKEKERRRLKAEKDAKDKEEKDKANAIKKATLAPDKVKLEYLSVKLTEVSLPQMTSEEGKKVLRVVVETLNSISVFVKKRSIEL